MKSFLRLKEFFLKHKWSYFIGIMWLVTVDAMQLIVPRIIGNLIDEFQGNLLDIRGLIRYSLYIIITGLIIGVGRYFWRIHIIGNSRKLEYYLRKKLFNHLLTLSPNYFNHHKTGDLMSHATNDINAVRMSFGFGLIMSIDSLFIITMALIMMVRSTSLQLTALAVFNIPILFITTKKFGGVIYNRSKRVQAAFSNLTEVTQESFAGIRVIKSFIQEDLVRDNFRRVNENNLRENLNLVKVSGLFYPFLQFISSLSLLVTIFYGGRMVIEGSISLGDFVAFTSYLGLLTWPTRALGMVINVFQRGAASMDRINRILDERAEIKEPENAIVPKKIEGNIEFRSVSFRYQGSNYNALEDINFMLEKGKTLAIVGRTGSGKTTIVNLLLRLYDIEEGEILIDGINIKDISLKALRENIGYVPQDNFLFSTTIRENIAFAFDELPKEEEIIEASKIAQVYDNIINFPKKFDTILGERGVTLSGGQKQRTSIARAVIKKPPVLILDDSLSAVDTETEERILKNIKEVTKDITTIIIAHRISTIKHADEILFLEDGRIVERGTHEELLNLKGQYQALYEKQLLEEKLKGKEG